jgi:hypothetical protein
MLITLVAVTTMCVIAGIGIIRYAAANTPKVYYNDGSESFPRSW